MNLEKSFKEGNHFNYVMAVGLTVVSAVQMIFTAYIFKLIIDIATEGVVSDIKRLLLISIAYIVVYYLTVRLCRFFKNRYLLNASMQYKNAVIEAFLGRGVETDTLAVVADYHAGVTLDIESIETNYILGKIDIVQKVVLVVLGLAGMFYLSLPITLFMIVSAIFPILISMHYSKRLSRLEQDVSGQNSNFISMLSDLLAGFSLIKIFHIEDEILRLFQKSNRSLETSKINRRSGRIYLNLAMNITGFVITIGVVALGMYLAFQKIITIGAIVAIVQLLNYVMKPAGEIGDLFSKRQAARTLITKMENKLQALAENKDMPSQGKFVASAVSLESDMCVVKDVGLTFPESDFSLANIDFTFERGKHYVIIGSSGSGKSTLLKLLLGFFPEYSGQIMFDGINLRELDRSYLYSKIAYVQQSTFIFNDSILNNVNLYRDHPAESVQYALKASGLDTIIESRGVDYQCGVSGKLISGGEQQRIAIARALLVKPEMLILDEATSALDYVSNQAIMDTILANKELTSISVMHRVDGALLKRFDSILIVDRGELKAHGSYADLSGQGEVLLDVLV